MVDVDSRFAIGILNIGHGLAQAIVILDLKRGWLGEKVIA
jgi:hypothetical protein